MYKFIKVGGDLFHKKETYNCIVSLISLSFCFSLYLSVYLISLSLSVSSFFSLPLSVFLSPFPIWSKITMGERPHKQEWYTFSLPLSFSVSLFWDPDGEIRDTMSTQQQDLNQRYVSQSHSFGGNPPPNFPPPPPPRISLFSNQLLIIWW